MKGVSIILLLVLIAVLSVITVVGTYLFATTSNVENIRRSIIERGIVGEVNKLEFLKQNLHQALDYSFYQSKYEVAKLGGYTTLTQAPITYNNLPYWRVYTNPYFPNYIKSLEDRTLELYNIYNKSIKTEISKPGSTEVIIERKITPSANYAIVTAFATKPIRLEKLNLTIEENGTINETIHTKIFEMFGDIGKENFVDKDSIKEVVITAIDSLNFAPTGFLKACGNCPAYEETFSHANHGISVSTAKELIKNKIREDIGNLANALQEEGIEVKVEIDTVKSHIDLDCTSEQDGCCLPCLYGCCAYWCTTTCNFYYYGAARVLVKITDTTTKYAVYDEEETDLRNIELKFYVVSGNKELIQS